MIRLLLWKAWRESRVRFLACAAVLAGAVIEFLVRSRTAFPPPEAPALEYTAFFWANLIGNRQPIVFGVMALVLGLGGLQRERAAATAAFTLVLPVTRSTLLGTRAMVGLVQVMTLAVVPLVVTALMAPVVTAHAYPVGQALRFAMLYAGWGVVFHAAGVLWSVVLPGTFAALTASILTPFVYLIFVASRIDDSGRYGDLNFATFMSGMRYFDRTRGGLDLLGGVFPWMSMLLLLLMAAAILLLAQWRTARHDF